MMFFEPFHVAHAAYTHAWAMRICGPLISRLYIEADRLFAHAGHAHRRNVRYLLKGRRASATQSMTLAAAFLHAIYTLKFPYSSNFLVSGSAHVLR